MMESAKRQLRTAAAGLTRSRRFAVMEAKEKRAGGSGILSKLGELMFAELVRRYVESLPEGSTGWLAGLRDRHIGRALNLLHAEPARAWTLDQLAQEIGQSRSSYGAQFRPQSHAAVFKCLKFLRPRTRDGFGRVDQEWADHHRRRH
jgi:AraC-like DNA-binding protein